MDEFSIEARSFKLVKGVGSFIRHNFWVLRNSSEVIVAELQGLATHRIENIEVPIGTGTGEYTKYLGF